MAHTSFISTDAATKSLLTGADTVDTIVPIARVMVLTVGDALLDEIAEFLKEVQLHPIRPFIITAIINVLLADQIILRFRVLLHTHDRTTTRKMRRSPWRNILNLQSQLTACRWLLRYAFRPSLGRFIVILIVPFMVLLPRIVLRMLHRVVKLYQVVWREFDVTEAALDVLFLKAKYLIRRYLSSKFGNNIVL
jgi:hypothetical protein